MTDYTGTFSECVDAVVDESGRADKILSVIAWANQSIRASQSKAYFRNDLIEDAITVTADPHIWTPLPDNFRLLRSALYPNAGTYPENKPPGRIQADQTEYYYGGSDYMVFQGTTGETDIDVAYYTKLLRLSYYADGERPALFDNLTQAWTYLENGVYVSTLGSDALDEAARALVTNWLLFSYFDMIKDGALSKLYYTLDDPRGPKHLGLFKDAQATLLATETFESLNV